jgi:hypothetical protein
MKCLTRILLLVTTLPLWAESGTDLSERLRGAADFTAREYQEERDALVKQGPEILPRLYPLATDPATDWKIQLMARIVYERIQRGKEIEAVLRHDWLSYPPYAKPAVPAIRIERDENGNERTISIPPPPGHVIIPMTGASSLMGKDVRKVLQEAGLWYWYVEQVWKKTNEGPPAMAFDSKFMDRWTAWCAEVVKEQPEKIWWARALADRLNVSDFQDWRDIKLFNELMTSGESEAVPFLVRRFDDYFRADTKGREANPGSWSRSYPSRFNRFLPSATSQHASLLENAIRTQPLLASLSPGLDEVRLRLAKDESDRLRFRLGSKYVIAPPMTR